MLPYKLSKPSRRCSCFKVLYASIPSLRTEEAEDTPALARADDNSDEVTADCRGIDPPL